MKVYLLRTIYENSLWPSVLNYSHKELRDVAEFLELPLTVTLKIAFF